MPPARKRLRVYDPAKTRKAVLAQFATVREAITGLAPEQLALPTRLGEWTVRDLAAHLTLAVESVSRALDRPEPAKAESGPLDYGAATAPFADAIAEGSHALAEAHPDLGALYAETERRITERLAATPHDRLVDTRAGAMSLADYLVTRTVELVVHTDDLNAAVPGLDLPFDRQALATCVRLLADTLAARAPGGSTEVRIPPYAVVQCVEGPRHTRGTPPNVVETDPLTWVRLATGRLEWATALDEAKVSASGERADLSALLPLLS
ncbi:maleylpyruvate isomerase family mycothiol-dependent enzyme [Streptomyces neyagawaensis]|uniref:maleylpyruvate isomerase family mycothiol-dependent enzyme n=1 Tax=Streptomyces neyagawaensis TaxID=42238 RepID=UPI00201D2964|nr:maleylpyruvate isomerase family mycothiol-dependent enzyme [Streptomyces neyagawaensis]MCL6738093.1 maleylpyruvate isomerase family mycothiol-dependent enzyme [Streptomyces neyagawaensis]MDE1681795.1 sterol carrier family protein [Streptomyces neyagawaensis]